MQEQNFKFDQHHNRQQRPYNYQKVESGPQQTLTAFCTASSVTLLEDFLEARAALLAVKNA